MRCVHEKTQRSKRKTEIYILGLERNTKSREILDIVKKDPLISIVVPSYNQGDYLRICLESMVSQDYLNYEIIVCDGGSTDASAKIIESYGNAVRESYSRKDLGQADALNWGFSRARGDVLWWVNSDDVLKPGALRLVASSYRPGLVMYAGEVSDFKNGSEVVRVVKQTALIDDNIIPVWRRKGEWHMPGLSFNAEVWRKFGPLDIEYRYLFDAKFVHRALTESDVTRLGIVLAGFRLHAESKTVKERFGFHRESLKLWWENKAHYRALDNAHALFYIGIRVIYGWAVTCSRL